ncbi:hypothetical protein ETH_00019835 [Eimeria tenella]|uniref:SAG family member n=1 Tax=Eimeria tenella TaxID=5802 RepID=U6KYG3_EIMTE|nr:hypothetical protein ETH_00019835 [Eimeria tenella]CDJ40530.1 hypothetical protein ETH_00019835 [Eimeria tenella]|eukprot:XP_013231280.1 hypothetical protein ETH_00019835 [Eimeria tenella]
MKTFVALAAALAATIPFCRADDVSATEPIVAFMQQDAAVEALQADEPTAVAVEESEGATPRVFFLDKLLAKFLLAKLTAAKTQAPTTTEHHHTHLYPTTTITTLITPSTPTTNMSTQNFQPW